MRVVVIGLGGIGTNLIDPLCRTLVFSESKRASKQVLLLDGDAYESRNRERQRYVANGNKAEATKIWLKESFPELEIEARGRYIDADSAYLFIKEGDTVFLGVDNHATRKVVSVRMGELSNGLLISGGNDKYDGNVQIYERRNGEDHTPPLTYQHPEIENPPDKNPAELGCDKLVARGEPQIVSVNNFAAGLMLSSYVIWLESGELPYREAYFDIKTGRVRPVKIER